MISHGGSWAAALAVASIAMGPLGVAAQAFPTPPAPELADSVRQVLVAFKGAERGPYERIRWFCNDGTVQPPAAGACSERGGGVQHAEPNARARWLADRQYHVGTILQALPYDHFADETNAGYRLREIVLERFLVEVDDGWVMRRARYYRGAKQIEDEERAGRALLEQRFADGAWLRPNYLLAARLAASVPHSSLGDGQTMDRIRAVSTQVAEADATFQPIRVKIHSMPSEADIAAVERYLARGSHAAEVQTNLTRLRDDLRLQYDPERALASLAAYERRVGQGELADGIASLRAALDAGDVQGSFQAIVQLAPLVRRRAEGAANGPLAVDLVDLGLSLQERAYVLADRLDNESPPGSRVEALSRLGRYVTLAYAAGYLSQREHDALQGEVSALAARITISAADYKASLAYLARSLDWARGTVRGTFAPVLDRYAAVDPAALTFYDATLRGSVVLPLSGVLDDLQKDADHALGATHSLFGVTEASGLRGLNPGVSVGPLDVLEPGHHEDVQAGTIYLLPETPPELKPVAGVLTFDEGNLLSHVQLLARNLGIPNAAVSPVHESRLLAARGEEVFYAVTPMGRVIVKSPDQLDDAERLLVGDADGAPPQRHRLDTSRLRLDVRTPIPLSRLRSTDSGVLVGPKAANLGQLAADFPGRVSPAVALPFGMFVEHASRPYGGSRGTVLDELRTAAGRAAAMRLQGRSEDEIDAMMMERLAWARLAIERLEWLPEQRRLVEEAVSSMLEGEIDRGVFIRSDTNVEDLPQFSGAGLNLTVPHQTSMEQILFSIKRVWTSPFADRAYLWRRQILEEQGEVYPSVLVQQTVPSARSGVLITTGLGDGGPDDLTVVAAEGVGGGVEGEDAETLLLQPDGGVRLLSQTKNPRRRQIVPGGTRWMAAARPDTLLTPGELAQLRAVVEEWEVKWVGTPDSETTWDMEFGFLDGRLWLFQVRPFIRFRNSAVYEALEALDAVALRNADLPVVLLEPLEGS
ncbi:MAG: hypothetical protein HKN72_01750 [Gemmatimonadetes bacterium]|nr:hypothetical protein [Gemmatimonadota bacterium]